MGGAIPLAWLGSCSGDQTTISYACPFSNGTAGRHSKTVIPDGLASGAGLSSSGGATTGALTGVPVGWGMEVGWRRGLRMGWTRDAARAAGAEVAIATGEDVVVGTADGVDCTTTAVAEAVGVG